LRDYTRFDFRAGADCQPRLLDVIPNPTWYPDSRIALMADWSVHSYADMVRLILGAAARRYGLQQ
jgi:D-alanine-D-alanine ligase